MPAAETTIYITLQDAVTPPVTGTPGSGDIDGDGYVTVGDAVMVARAVVGATNLTAAQLAAVDMDNDGYLTMVDAILVMRKAAGL